MLKPDGTKVGGRPNIGALLRQTSLNSMISLELIEYLVIELFEERNPVLHGRVPDFGSIEKASSLLLVIEIIENVMTSAIKEMISEDYCRFLEEKPAGTS